MDKSITWLTAMAQKKFLPLLQISFILQDEDFTDLSFSNDLRNEIPDITILSH